MNILNFLLLIYGTNKTLRTKQIGYVLPLEIVGIN